MEDQLVGLPRPPGTELIASYSQAGKLVGNGNGMRYLGAILITSDLTLTALTTFSAEHAELLDQHRHSEYPLTLQIEATSTSELRDIRRASRFLAQTEDPGSYVA